jgi:hypothetical protein
MFINFVFSAYSARLASYFNTCASMKKINANNKILDTCRYSVKNAEVDADSESVEKLQKV